MRKQRIWYPGAKYHVMNRGANRMEIFGDDRDRKKFMQIANEAADKFGCKIKAYCLMPNHYHLLVETSDVEIGKMMKSLGQRYTEYFNYKYRRDGALFRGRYHSKVITSEVAYNTVVRYIHNNPVRARLVAKPEEYVWSSCKGYGGKASNYFENKC